MRKSIKTILAGLLFVPLVALAVSFFTPVATSVNAACAGGTTVQDGAECLKNDTLPIDLPTTFTQIANVALYIIGAVSVLMIIYGGIRYTLSGGDSAAITAAKSTIMYAVIGVIVALLAYAIVNFVLINIKAAP